MNRSEYVLSVMALQGTNAYLSPVQVQKLFFILDQEMPQQYEGARFHFKPYDYGPFDSSVYSEIENHSRSGLAQLTYGPGYRCYALTDAGLTAGNRLAARLPLDVRAYIERVGTWVRQLSFQQLVSAIYKQYPAMRAKSVFRE